MTPQSPVRRLARMKLAADRSDPRLRARRVWPERKARGPRPLDGNRLASLSTRRRLIPRDFAARAALPRDRRHRGRSLRTLPHELRLARRGIG